MKFDGGWDGEVTGDGEVTIRVHRRNCRRISEGGVNREERRPAGVPWDAEGPGDHLAEQGVGQESGVLRGEVPVPGWRFSRRRTWAWGDRVGVPSKRAVLYRSRDAR